MQSRSSGNRFVDVDHRQDRSLQGLYLFSVAAGSLPAVEPGILPGGMGVWFEKPLPFRTSCPGGKMPPSTAAKMAAATDVDSPLNTYPIWNRQNVARGQQLAG